MKGVNGDMKAMIYATKKRDDDAAVVQQGDEVFLSTTETLPGVSYAPLDEEEFPSNTNTTTTSMMEDAATAPRRDIRVQVIYNIFLTNGLYSIGVMILSLPFFFWPFVTRQAASIVLTVSCILLTASYFGAMFARKAPRVAIGMLGVMFFASVGIIGPSSNLTGNVAPIQLMFMLFVECMAIVFYARFSPQSISTVYAMMYMAIGALIVWAISIAVFVVERDWVSGTIILIIAGLCTAYHGLQIRLTEARYNLSWEDTILSIVQFYCDPILLVVAMARAN